MKQVEGFWLPDNETHLGPFLQRGPRFAGGPTYQFAKFARAFPLIKNFRAAIDVGAHCGLWSRVFERCFSFVAAFEPVFEHRECFIRNMPGGARIELLPYALGADLGAAWMDRPGHSSGGSHISERKAGPDKIDVRRLDDYTPAMPADFLKIDCEGYEFFVIQGGEQFIKHYRPTIVVEQKPGHGRRYGLGDTDAVPLLVSWGYAVEWEIAGDFCLTCS